MGRDIQKGKKLASMQPKIKGPKMQTREYNLKYWRTTSRMEVRVTATYITFILWVTVYCVSKAQTTPATAFGSQNRKL